ncbi:anti-sigma factor antagonist [Actinomadura sp. KC216]|uniref:STAS domain-containing protein n=1 Tax=Actinomadura sp. KC216 TaxID=2530370 RepID=UPI001052EDEF|nr:STAS domain-containing protein [Actinomadura sp. KC216]TDB84641.1 anti-sigma factor antagonist [Actinomadura sp. KC216]
MTRDLDVTIALVREQIAVLTAAGELSYRTSPALIQHATTIAERGHPDLILDLAQVLFWDSSGLSALIVTYRRLTSVGGSLTLTAPPERLRHVLTTTGIDQVISTHPTLDEALRATQPVASDPASDLPSPPSPPSET